VVVHFVGTGDFVRQEVVVHFVDTRDFVRQEVIVHFVGTGGFHHHSLRSLFIMHFKL